VKIKSEDSDEETVLENVPREVLTSYRYRDAKIMTDILLYRTQYKAIVTELKKCFAAVYIFKDDKKIRTIEEEEESDYE
jgi:hypothetical protein